MPQQRWAHSNAHPFAFFRPIGPGSLFGHPMLGAQCMLRRSIVVICGSISGSTFDRWSKLCMRRGFSCCCAFLRRSPLIRKSVQLPIYLRPWDDKRPWMEEIKATRMQRVLHSSFISHHGLLGFSSLQGVGQGNHTCCCSSFYRCRLPSPLFVQC